MPQGKEKDFGIEVGKAKLNAALEFEVNDLRATNRTLVKALKAIMRDLPAKRDWLDPVIEAQAKAALAAAGKGD